MDSTFRLFFITSNSTAHTLDVSYILRRLGTLPTLLTSAPINRVRQFSTATTTSDTYFPNITWLDSPPPGIHNYRIEIMATASVNITTLQVTNRALNAVAQITSDPFNIYVRAGSFGGNGSLEAPFGTIEEGITAVAQGGTVYVLEGIYNIATQLIISKSLSLNGTLAASTPQIVFDPSTNLNGLVIQADQVMIDSLHIISNRAVTGDNAVFRVPLRTLAQLYNNITIRNSIIEGTTRSGYIWAENMTLDNNEFIHNAVNTQGLRFQMVRGTTNILNNTFRGGSTSIGAIVFEPNIASYTVSGIINVTGNTMTRFTQFVNFFCIIEGPTSLIIQNNSVDHEDRSGSSIILFARVNYALMNNILIQNNSIVNIFPTRLAVYFAGGGTFIPSANQIKVYTNTFNFPNGYGSPTDTVDPVFPVGYSNASPPGMSLGAFDLQGNVNV
ncbi:hypothetical protein ACFOLF_20800 [Paenibacillus sepulcri]|uniref:hypothetical protein n=1 Tax=Paenibacillus sepulcri TaxID=359917 RepID=UPI003620385E